MEAITCCPAEPQSRTPCWRTRGRDRGAELRSFESAAGSCEATRTQLTGRCLIRESPHPLSSFEAPKVWTLNLLIFCRESDEGANDNSCCHYATGVSVHPGSSTCRQRRRRLQARRRGSDGHPDNATTTMTYYDYFKHEERKKFVP